MPPWFRITIKSILPEQINSCLQDWLVETAFGFLPSKLCPAWVVAQLEATSRFLVKAGQHYFSHEAIQQAAILPTIPDYLPYADLQAIHEAVLNHRNQHITTVCQLLEESQGTLILPSLSSKSPIDNMPLTELTQENIRLVQQYPHPILRRLAWFIWETTGLRVPLTEAFAHMWSHQSLPASADWQAFLKSSTGTFPVSVYINYLHVLWMVKGKTPLDWHNTCNSVLPQGYKVLNVVVPQSFIQPGSHPQQVEHSFIAYTHQAIDRLLAMSDKADTELKLHDYSWARLDVCETQVEVYVGSNFIAWNKSYEFVEEEFTSLLRRYNLPFSHIKKSTMLKGFIFIVFQDLKTAAKAMDTIINESLAGRLQLPTKLTLDYSHSQMAVFRHYYGRIPNPATTDWPHPDMARVPALPIEAGLRHLSLQESREQTTRSGWDSHHPSDGPVYSNHFNDHHHDWEQRDYTRAHNRSQWERPEDYSHDYSEAQCQPGTNLKRLSQGSQSSPAGGRGAGRASVYPGRGGGRLQQYQTNVHALFGPSPTGHKTEPPKPTPPEPRPTPADKDSQGYIYPHKFVSRGADTTPFCQKCGQEGVTSRPCPFAQ